MLFSLLKHYLDLYISDTALKVFRSLYCFTTSICHGVENYFPRLWGTGTSDVILLKSVMTILYEKYKNPSSKIVTQNTLTNKHTNIQTDGPTLVLVLFIDIEIFIDSH